MNERNRLGYACINQELREQKIYTGRTMTAKKFAELGLAGSSERGLANIQDLKRIVEWNHANDIQVYRMSSDIIPRQSEFQFTELPDYEEIKQTLRTIGTIASSVRQRLSYHPGPFNVLASPNPDVVTRTIDELNKHAQIMDMMGLPESRLAKINIHVGGAYGEKEAALKRFCDNFKRLQPSAQARLTVENDDKASMYSVRELYDNIYKRIGVPIVFDYHHHTFNTGGLSEQEALEMALSTWDVRPCTHVSNSRRDEQMLIVEETMRSAGVPLGSEEDHPTLGKLYKDIKKLKQQAHSDYITSRIETYGHTFDIVLEAKEKEKAVQKYRKLFSQDLLPV